MRRWTEEERQFVLKNAEDMQDAEIAKALGRDVGVVSALRRKISGAKHRRWTPEEESYLCENWGHMTFDGICKHLDRSKHAILTRVQRLGLPPYLESGDYITMHQLILALGLGASDKYTQTSWVEKRGFPVHNKRRGACTYRVVYLSEFWEWAEKNRSFLNLGKMEPLALGAEPDWVPEQRRKDFNSFALQRKDPWTSDEDSRLIMLLKQHRYGYAELSDLLHRSAGAIQRRCCDLGIKERPIKAENHGTEAAWTDEDFAILADGIRNGDSYTMIGMAIGKSEKAVRGKVYFTYLTESADKVRAYMGVGQWGDGAPEPTVKQGIHLSRTRTETKNLLEQLAGVLYRRTLELKKTDYDYYFQRAVCENWNELDSCCAAGCNDCDSCAEFKRIRPQYCARCGATFYERGENRICKACRVARKKQHFRKLAILNARNTR